MKLSIIKRTFCRNEEYMKVIFKVEFVKRKEKDDKGRALYDSQLFILHNDFVCHNNRTGFYYTNVIKLDVSISVGRAGDHLFNLRPDDVKNIFNLLRYGKLHEQQNWVFYLD